MRVARMKDGDIKGLVEFVREKLQQAAYLIEADDIAFSIDDYQNPDYQNAVRVLEKGEMNFPVKTDGRVLRFSGGRFSSAQIDFTDFLITSLVNMPEPRKLKSCKVCNDLFWAKRKDQKTCSSDHANSYRQWKYYSKHTRLKA